MTSAVTTAVEKKPVRDHHRLIVVALYGLALFGGFIDAVSTNGLVMFLFSLLFATLAASWCAMDARIRGNPMLPVVQMIVLLTWPIAVPVYLIQSRGARGLLYLFIHGLGLYVAAVIPDAIARTILRN